MPRESFDSEDSSSSGVDDVLYEDLPKRTTERKKKKPNRYGSVMNQNISTGMMKAISVVLKKNRNMFRHRKNKNVNC